MLGDSVVGVKHCMDPRGGKVTRATWGMFAVGAACLVSSAVAFKMSVDTATFNRGKLDYITRVQKKPAHTFRPKTDGPGLDALMFGGLGLGLLGMTMGLARLRRERKSPYYRIGTAPGVEQPLEGAPSAEFPLVAPSGDDFVFNFGAGIDGEMTVDGTTVPLAQLAATGRARASATTAGAIEVPIPANARIRARAGNTTFLVSAVGKPRAQTVPLWSMENRTMAYFAGSLAAHVGLWAFLQTVPMNAEGAQLDLASIEATDIRAVNINTEDQVPEKEKEDDLGNSGGSEGMGARMRLEEGAAGKPDSLRADGHMQIKNNNKEPSLSREQAIEEARNAGFLGSASALSGGIASLASQADYSSGFDGANVYGPLFGSEGEGKGSFGGGVHGFGMGGGCTQEPCGVIGTSRYGTIGTGTKAGDGWGGPGTGHGPLRRRTSNIPGPTIGIPNTTGDLDREIIRRYVKRNYEKIAYCYERKLMANPGIEGQMSVSFLIAPDGTVQSSNGSGFDGEVAGCVAGVVKQIKFPRPNNGGPVQVNYPFTFHAVGR